MLITRRTAIPAAALLAAAPLLAAEAKEPEVTATEDLMREHGVIRRAILVYAEAARRLREQPASFDASPLRKTAELFRRFAEEYHEEKLEEAHIFPVIRKMPAVASYADVLTEQHKRGREITVYTLAVTSTGKVPAAHQAPLARALDGLVRMYEPHAAREDTVVFPAWKRNYTQKQLDALSDEFEDIERKTFGHDGFEDAEKTIAGIESAYGMSDLAHFTPPPPPKV